ncbi:MAG TPA: hypothetical protein VM260_03030 [Pirellula sp.]|nr:hypothetical protein [Pirellula sp.]
MFRLVFGMVLFFVFFFVPGCDTKQKQSQITMPAVTLNPPTVEELTERLMRTVDELAQSLGDIRDEATANAALLKIEEATVTVVGLKLSRLPDSHKSAMIDLVKPMVNKLVQVLKGLYKLPGVQAIIEPSITPMLSRLQAFANVKAD